MAVVNRALRTDSERTRRNILDSARDLCREQGYEHIRMADVAERVGCARATVYNHFPSRDGLLEALSVEFLDGYLELLAGIPAWIREDHTVFQVLRETVARELRWRAEHGELRGALDSAKRLRKPFYVEANQRIDDAMIAWLEAIYNAADGLGLVREDLDLDLAGRPVYAMIDSVVAGFPVGVAHAEVERVADQVARLQWHALFAAEPEDAVPFAALAVDPARIIGRKRPAPVAVRRRRSSTPA
jgi:AcrR family transcriptional regulator